MFQKVKMCAGTIGELLVRQGYCSRGDLDDYFVKFVVEVNGVVVFHKTQIVYKGDMVSIQHIESITV